MRTITARHGPSRTRDFAAARGRGGSRLREGLDETRASYASFTWTHLPSSGALESLASAAAGLRPGQLPRLGAAAPRLSAEALEKFARRAPDLRPGQLSLRAAYGPTLGAAGPADPGFFQEPSQNHNCKSETCTLQSAAIPYCAAQLLRVEIVCSGPGGRSFLVRALSFQTPLQPGQFEALLDTAPLLKPDDLGDLVSPRTQPAQPPLRCASVRYPSNFSPEGSSRRYAAPAMSLAELSKLLAVAPGLGPGQLADLLRGRGAPGGRIHRAGVSGGVYLVAQHVQRVWCL